MEQYRNALPQLSGELFLMDAGIETDIIFNRGVDIPEFAAHTLLATPEGRATLSHYFRGFLTLAKTSNVGLILDTQTWKAHTHWAKDLGATQEELRAANRASVSFISGLRDEFSNNAKPIVLNALIGPRGDAYAPDQMIAASEAEDYHAQQMGWLADTEVDMVSALTFTQSDEAIGAVRAAKAVGLPVVVSFTVETDGALPTDQSLGAAITAVDEATDQAAAYFMVNCAHPDHFMHLLEDVSWSRRIRGLRCNASRMSHAELDECEVLDDGDPVEMGRQYQEMKERLPWLNIFGGCCGSDLRHVAQIVKGLTV
jgi:S-methylmethionine-dependent homocysteine/selenocysteine methylase